MNKTPMGPLPTPQDLHLLEEECRREVSMRRRVFARQVAEGKMNQRQADFRIAQMEALVTLLAELQKPGSGLFHDLGNGRAGFIAPDLIGRWLADPKAFAANFAKPEAAE